MSLPPPVPPASPSPPRTTGRPAVARGPDEDDDGSSQVIDASREGIRKALATAVHDTLHEEAQRNEERVAWVRLASYSLIVIFDVVLYFAGLRPLLNLWTSVPAAAVSAAIAAVLRRTYLPWFRFAIPLVDALLIGAIISVRVKMFGVYPGYDAIVALACGLYATTGGFRFDLKAAVLTTVMGGALLVFLIGGHAKFSAMLYATASLIGIGILNGWQSDLVRRSMQGARGRELLARFLPRALVESAFSSSSAVFLEPRLVEATVLVSDIRGFTALAESLPPGEVLERLNELQGALADAVQRHGGTVDKFMGDGMLAVFGAYGATEDHAGRALLCVASLMRALQRVNERHPGSTPLKVGVGIHSGPLVAGCLGAGSRLELTVIGDTVNTASRLESLTKEVGVDVLVGEPTFKLVAPGLLRDCGEVAVRGKQSKLRVFTLA